MKKIIKVNGMKCLNCANRLKNVLEKIDNIDSINVNLEKKNIEIEYKKELNLDLVKEKINEIGFQVIE